jgi:hypothetical protein
VNFQCKVVRVEEVIGPMEPKWFWDYRYGRVGYEEGELSIKKDDEFVRDLLQVSIYKANTKGKC